MKAAVLTARKRCELTQVPRPTLVHDTDVLIKIAAVGVCGSDVHYFTSGGIGSQMITYPFTVGHEAAGTVVEIGGKVTRVQPGTRIAIDPAVTCGECDQCRSARENTCRELRFMGCPDQLEGCLCEYVVLPQGCCFPIPRSMSFEEALLTEPLAIAMYAVRCSPVSPGAAVAVLGAGPIGLSVASVLRTQDIGSLYITDKIPERLGFAERCAPAWCGSPEIHNVVDEISKRDPLLLDVVFECSGDPAAITQGIALLKPGGTLLIVGIPEPELIELPVHDLRHKELTIRSVRRQASSTQAAIDLIRQREVEIGAFVTHRFTLEQTQAAFELVAGYQDGVIKAVVLVSE